MERIFISMLSFAMFAGVFSAVPATARAFELASSAFKDGGAIPVHFARPAVGGHNVSIPLQWSGAPDGTKSFALAIVDIHPVAKNWVHWLVINIPAKTASLPEGASGKKLPTGAAELKNSFGSTGYGGPQPPKGTGPHSYVITLFALNTDKLDLQPETTLVEFQRAIKGKVIGEAAIQGIFEQ